MVLSIKDPETDRLARELAALTGESITVATRRAIEERLVRVKVRMDVAPLGDELGSLVFRGRARLQLDRRGPDEILGYDEHGLPS